MQRKILMITLFLAALYTGLMGQDATSVKVDELSDQQIQTIVNEVNARGWTFEQAAQLAEMRGASSAQIEELKARLQGGDVGNTKTTDQKQTQGEQKTVTTKDAYTKKALTKPTEKEKKIFGFQFFNNEKLSFEPAVNVLTPANYVLGVDDELVISISGASQKTFRVKVESTGAINIQDIGPVYVAGMEFSKAKELIKKRLATIFRGLTGASPNTFCDVSISNLRSIHVNVIGEAKTPGTYTVPSTTSAFNVLYLSGGPSENGSFRSIQIIRDDAVFKTMDVYEYLINSDAKENVSLREQDIIKIPVYQKRVVVDGAFKRNGYFELTTTETLADLIKYAGGFNDQAFQSQVSVRRISEKGRTLLDVEQPIYNSFILQNGDSVVAAKAIDRFENRVTLTGAVFMPGSYGLTDGLKLSDLLGMGQGVKESHYDRGMIIRLQQNLTPEIVSFSVKEVLNGTRDIPLQREDRVVIEDIFKMKEKTSVSIFGEVQRPGDYEYTDNTTLKDLILQAGGFNEAASESFIEVARRHDYNESGNIQDELVKLYQFDIDRELNLGGKGDAFVLKPYDYVYVRKSPSYYRQRTVYITGEVRYPGPYSIGSKKERVSDLIKRAGGLMPNAFVKGAVMQRENKLADKNKSVLENTMGDTISNKVKTQITNSQLELQLESILKTPGTEYDYLLKDGDQINIPEFSQEVRISGEIRNPIGLAYKVGRSLMYYVERNGGFTENALESKIFVIYSDGTTKVTRHFIFRTYPDIQPGCQIIIPAKPLKQAVDNSGKWMALASTLASMLVAISYLIK